MKYQGVDWSEAFDALEDGIIIVMMNGGCLYG